MKFDAVKSMVKRNGFLKTHALALTRTRHPVANILHLSRNLIFSRVFPRTLVSYEGCDRASAKDFHEIRAVFTRGVVLSPSLDQLGAIEREASFL